MLNIVVVPSLSGHYSASWPTITHDPHSSQCEQSGLATRTSTGLVSGVVVLVHNFHEPNEQPVLEDANRDTVAGSWGPQTPSTTKIYTTDPGGGVRTRGKSWSEPATLRKTKITINCSLYEKEQREPLQHGLDPAKEKHRTAEGNKECFQKFLKWDCL